MLYGFWGDNPPDRPHSGGLPKLGNRKRVVEYVKAGGVVDYVDVVQHLAGQYVVFSVQRVPFPPVALVVAPPEVEDALRRASVVVVVVGHVPVVPWQRLVVERVVGVVAVCLREFGPELVTHYGVVLVFLVAVEE